MVKNNYQLIRIPVLKPNQLINILRVEFLYSLYGDYMPFRGILLGIYILRGLSIDVFPASDHSSCI